MLKLEERVAGRYVVKELMGEGPTGFSYGVYDGSTRQNIRLKMIHPHLLQTVEEQRNFGIVLEKLGYLAHTSMSRVLERGNVHGRIFYTQQQAEGLSLRRIMDERLVKGSLFSCKEVEPIFGQLLQALEAVHRVGFHLNLKPENIFVLPDILKLTDVGLGLALLRQTFVQAQREYKVEGYLAPEFLSGEEVEAGVDVYALGAILGEMLAGVLPESGRLGLRRNNPAIPVQLELIYRKAVAENPQARYRSIAEFYEVFSAFYRGQTPEGLFFEPGQEEVTQVLASLSPEPSPQVYAEISNETSISGLKSPFAKGLKRFKWVFIGMGATLLGVFLYLAFRDATPEGYTGRNVEGFVQHVPVVPVPVELPEVEGAHTEALPPELLEEPAPPVVLPEKAPEVSRTPSRGNIPPVVAAPRCPEQMRYIAPGVFRMGTAKEDDYLSFEDLPIVVKEVLGFCVDIYEYPNRAGQVPQVNVGWAKARELCQKQGKRLCTEVEWEKACRGGQSLRWPYGNVFDEGACNAEGGTGASKVLAAAGRFPRCISAYAVLDMSGNVAEWTEERLAKGGSFSGSEHDVRCVARKTKAAATGEVGFRCCANPK